MPLVKPPPGTLLDTANPLARSLAGAWELREGAGARVADSSGRGRAGTLNGGAVWTPGRDGPALDFDGTDGYVGCGPAIPISPEFAVECWFRSTGTADNAQRLVCNGSNTWELYASFSAGTASFGVEYSPFAVAQAGLAAGWNHLVGQRNAATGNLELWVNGQLAATASCPAPTTAASGNLEVGRFSGGGFYTRGQIGRVRVETRSLSAGEVGGLYADGHALFLPPSTRRYFTFAASGGGGGPTVIEATGTAAGASTASAVGAALASATATASGSSSAAAIGAGVFAATATAGGASTAAGVGAAIVATTATSTATSAATAVGASLASTTGTADGTSTATGSGGTAGATPAPLTIADLVAAWLAESIPDATDGAPLDSWPDASGHGHDGTASGTQRPTYTAIGINALPVVESTADGQWLDLPASITLPDAYTLYFVAYRPSDNLLRVLAGAAGSATVQLNGTNAQVVDDTNSAASGFFFSGGGAYLWRFRRAGAGQPHYFAASSLAESSIGTTGPVTLDTLLGKSGAGQSTASGDQVAAILLYSRDLVGTADDAEVQQYFVDNRAVAAIPATTTIEATGTAAGGSTASAVGAAIASTVGNAAGASTATAIGTAVFTAIGTASGSSSAAGTGSALASATGTAAGTSTAMAAGSSVTSGAAVGTASGSSSALAVGAALAAGTGAAVASATASGVGAAVISATASAAGASTALGVGADGSAVILPATLLAAIRAYWDGDSGLAAAVGPLFAGKARPGLPSTSPWVRVQQESVTNRFDVLRGHYELRTVTFLVRAPTVAAADLGAEAIITALDATPVASLAFAGASLVGFRRAGGAMAAETDLGPGGKPVHGARVGYRALVVRP